MWTEPFSDSPGSCSNAQEQTFGRTHSTICPRMGGHHAQRGDGSITLETNKSGHFHPLPTISGDALGVSFALFYIWGLISASP